MDKLFEYGFSLPLTLPKTKKQLIVGYILFPFWVFSVGWILGFIWLIIEVIFEIKEDINKKYND